MRTFLTWIVAFVLMGCSSYAEGGAMTLPESVVLPAQSKVVQSVTVGPADEDITLSATEQWFGVVGGSSTVSQGAEQSVKLWVEPNFSTTERKGEITVVGAKSGKSVTISVTQPPYFASITESLPARLECQTSSCDTSKWVSDGVCTPKGSSAVLCAVSKSGKELTYSVNSGACVAGMSKGDYLLFAVPTKGVKMGEQVDFMCTIAAVAASSPKYFIFEYWDGGQWHSVKESLRTAAEDSAIKYSLYCKYFTSAHNTTFTQSFTLTNPVIDGCVKVRLRCLSSGSGAIRIPSSRGYMGIYLIDYPEAPRVTEKRKILFIGNSFTYFYGTPFMFKEIARSEGHQVDAVVSVKGGQEFSEHLNLELSLDAIKQGGYDYAFLQDTSPNPAIYADTGKAEILEACKQINALTMTYSPSCQIIYERTWACPYDNYRGYGSYDKLDYLLKLGSQMLQAELEERVVVSPVGLGFKLAREQGIDLLYSDDRHQNRAGAYMKACINYLIVYNTRFSANVSNCGVSASTAQKIRDIAERVVFDGVEENYSF